jgi:hypothetical protein
MGLLEGSAQSIEPTKHERRIARAVEVLANGRFDESALAHAGCGAESINALGQLGLDVGLQADMAAIETFHGK